MSYSIENVGKDVGGIVLDDLNDEDFLNVCKTNKSLSKLCNETYFRTRTEKRFPETIYYKTSDKTWKQYYLELVYYIDKLKTKFKYYYKSQDRNPKLVYKTLEFFRHSFTLADNYVALIEAAKDGNLEVVKFLVEQGVDFKSEQNVALRSASRNGYLEIVKYLVEQGANINSKESEALRSASYYGHLEVVKYLVEHGADIHALNNQAVRFASENEHSAIVAYLVEQMGNNHEN